MRSRPLRLAPLLFTNTARFSAALRTRTFHSTAMNPSDSTSSLLSAIVSNPKSSAAVPDHSSEKAHHAKDGKGFVNPWPSYREMAGFAIMKAIIWCACSLAFID